MASRDPYLLLKDFLHQTDSGEHGGYFDRAVEAIARMVGSDLAFVARVLATPAPQVRVLAAWQAGQHKEGWDFDLPGTPCSVIYDHAYPPDEQIVVLNGRNILIPRHLRHKFEAIRNTDYQGFVGIPLWNCEGGMIGHVAVFFIEPLADDAQTQWLLDVLQVVARRTEAELERTLLEERLVLTSGELQHHNRQLTQDSITDALT